MPPEPKSTFLGYYRKHVFLKLFSCENNNRALNTLLPLNPWTVLLSTEP